MTSAEQPFLARQSLGYRCSLWVLILLGAMAALLTEPRMGRLLVVVACIGCYRLATCQLRADHDRVVVRNAYRTVSLSWREVDAILMYKNQITIRTVDGQVLAVDATKTTGLGRRAERVQEETFERLASLRRGGQAGSGSP